MREQSYTSQLRKAGFVEPARCASLLDDPALAGMEIGSFLADFHEVADPDQCLLALIRLAEACQEAEHSKALASLLGDSRSRRELFGLLGMSTMLGDFLISHPDRLKDVFAPGPRGACGIPRGDQADERASALTAVGANPSDAYPVSTEPDAINALRAHYFTRIARVAAADLTCPDPLEAMPEVSARITDIVGGALEAGLAYARSEVEGSEHVALTVIAMGKTGARELNYVSDVDVVYVASPTDDSVDESQAMSLAAKLAAKLGQAVSAPAGEQALWMLDANLRPEGKDGPLVRTLESHVAYYKRWAKGWEFQALLKARPAAGDMALGQRYIDTLWPEVWEAASREHFVEDSRAMRRRVEAHVPHREEGRQLKLGKGGLRDIEFTVQLLQLVHGRSDDTLRTRSTLDSIAALRDGGYIARKDADLLDHDYRLLRTLEHRIQLQRLRRSHLVPSGEAELRRVARAMHCEGITTGPEIDRVWQETRSEVRRLHQAIYYRPLLPEAAKLSPDDISLDQDAAKARLASMGYLDPGGAINHISALTSGVSRTASIQRQLLPVMLGWFAAGPEPDRGLLAFRVLSEKMGRTSWYLRTLRDGGAAAERLCLLLSSSRYLAQNVPDLPESVGWLVDKKDLQPRTRAELDAELASTIARRTSAEDIANAGRYMRRRELLRTAMGQVLGVVDAVASRAAVSRAAEIAISAGLTGAVRAACEAAHISGPVSRYSVIAMGRLGGAEMGYASDADVIFVHDPLAGADEEEAQRVAVDVATRLSRLMGSLSGEPQIPVDYDLRPEGRNGRLTRSLAAYAEYYERWADPWEYQALLRARPIAGDAELGSEFISLIDPYRYPQRGLEPAKIREIQRIKARVETERIPRGISVQRHLKLGRGGLSDVEWTAQLLQLEKAGTYESLRVTSTLEVLAACEKAGILTSEQAEHLSEAWNMASLLRDMNFIGTGRSQGTKIDVLPHDLTDLGVVAALLGFESSQRLDVEEEYLRAARRARAVVEDVFYAQAREVKER
ncbi:bifunctional [glutamine synthetase] adenylyltransferase/[glutamine synthetase]-adenylyl-L-tyrosine phosphorylase [Ancrocorticia populi]|uniref:Bifunctional glutamine-synthetase adenylyltransferase/deadenyltransferase n=1 Tax=Ancrocorticia populi TaxID=2175228 RepID=A0A2V1K2R5_9ACTO|nr:bifunctional [glutamine synthetase] adenylyltransferase/[glutamine synthetase]-adenylyl-L-tyrosine phosphorylase [Ancrocorticia populi]PWF24513.1 bifunctional glutamine-synthetase adenylyltransferase/deadenyltransferase [Ancrocorticia populi]